LTQPTYNSTSTLATTAAGVPTIAIVGRPNVGKSTLFNRIVGSRRAIVGDEPGITRDRLYGDAEWGGRRLRVIDTGGILPEEKDFIPSEIFRQARVAFEEAAAIVMVVDGRAELAGLRQREAKVVVRLLVVWREVGGDLELTNGALEPIGLQVDQPEVDPLSREKAGLLDRAQLEKVVPKIFFSNTSYEYWGRAASLLHTTADGLRDVPPGPNVRIYYFTGLQHFSGPFPPARGAGSLFGQQLQSPLPVRYFWRAMIANMDAWVRSGTAPPPSAYPTIVAHTLVPLGAYAFPRIPHVEVPTEANSAYRLAYGPNGREGILSVQPPSVGKPFPVLVPQVDADGNELGGVHLPEISVPLATYTGWNLRDPSIGAAPQRVSFEGSYLPFPWNAAESAKAGDPRKSIADRYPDRDTYLGLFAHAADELIRQRWILPEDRAALLQRGGDEWDLLAQQAQTK